MYISYKFSQHNKSPEPHFWPQSPVISKARLAGRPRQDRRGRTKVKQSTTQQGLHSCLDIESWPTYGQFRAGIFLRHRGEWRQLLMIESQVVIELLYSNQDTSGPDCSWSWQDLKGYWLGHTQETSSLKISTKQLWFSRVLKILHWLRGGRKFPGLCSVWSRYQLFRV